MSNLVVDTLRQTAQFFHDNPAQWRQGEPTLMERHGIPHGKWCVTERLRLEVKDATASLGPYHNHAGATLAAYQSLLGVTRVAHGPAPELPAITLLAIWNDATGRTVEEVVVACKEAAKRLEATDG